MQRNQGFSTHKVRCKCHYLLLSFFSFLLLIIWTALLVSMVKDRAIPLFTASSDYDINSYRLSIPEYRKSIPGLIYEPFDVEVFSQSNDIHIEKFPLGQLISNWNPDDVSVEKWSQSLAHPSRGKSVPRFDYSDKEQYNIALMYREAELPFIVYNVPEVESAIVTAFTLDNLKQNFGDRLLMVDQSTHRNHFTYYKENHVKLYQKKDPFWKAPQKPVEMKFEDFIYLSQQAEKFGPLIINETLHYYTISASEGYQLDWLKKALPFFRREKSFFIVDPGGFKGINCRFGQKGVIATAHYDGGRNFVVMLRGRKRYILLPPKECQYLHLLPRLHPSARHSDIDWSDMKAVQRNLDLWNAQATEVVLGPGDVLYIPGYWFHYIMSQDASIQCNARSGDSHIGRDDITACGFYDSPNDIHNTRDYKDSRDSIKSKERPPRRSKPEKLRGHSRSRPEED